MRDLQRDAAAWHRETFGETTPQLLRAIRDKLREEAAEADEALGLNELAAEMADVLIVLLVLADRLEFDLLDEARVKFDELRMRQYAGADEHYRRLA